LGIHKIVCSRAIPVSAIIKRIEGWVVGTCLHPRSAGKKETVKNVKGEKGKQLFHGTPFDGKPTKLNRPSEHVNTQV